MKRVWAIARATALELECESLNLLVTLTALALATYAGALHYHQFGEAARMAREAGLSALLIPGIAYAVLGATRTMRRETESRTLEMALAHSVSRGAFLAAKLLGVMMAHLVFFATVWANSLVAVRGSVIGAAAAQGDIARVWGPSLAIGTAAIVLPPVLGAILNRFASMRFARSATFLALATTLAGTCYRFDAALAWRQLAIALPIAAATWGFAAIAIAAATILKTGAACSLVFAIAALSLPVLGAHYIPDAFRPGNAAPWPHVALAFASAALLAAAALITGNEIMKDKDIQ